MSFHSIQKTDSVASALWRAITATVFFGIAPLALAQQVLSPATISFGNVPLTLPVTQTATFTNNSTFQSVTITGLSTSDARFVATGSGVSPCNAGAVVSFGASCTYALTFTPTGTGAFNNITSVAYNLLTTPQTPLTQASSGTGFTPPSTASPASINFGNVPVTLTVTQNLTFTNTSNTTMFPASYTLASIATAGLGYTAVGSGATPCAVSLVLAPATSCTMTVSFQIGGTGSSNGTTTIGYQAGFGANPVFSAVVTLVGNGILMPSSLSPTSIAFGNVTVGTPVTQAFTFTNDSNTTAFPSTYTITNFATTGLGFSAVGSGAAPCAAGLTLAPGANCGATVTFQIFVTGSSNGTTTIDFLAGLGSDPPYSKSFGSSGNGVAGPLPAITSAASASGTVGSAFTYQIVATNTPTSFGASGLPAGLGINTATGQITGTPTSAGTFSAMITATNLSGTGSQLVTINIAAASAPTMTVAFAPASVSTNTNATMTLTLTNPNATPAAMSIGGSVTMPFGLNLSGLVDGCGASASVIVSTVTTINLGMGGTIPAFGSCTITVQAKSTTPGSFPVTVLPGNLITALGNNTNTSTATLTVASTTATYSPAGGLAFGNRTVGATSTPLTATFTNTSPITLTISSISFLGGGAGFSVLGSSKCLTTPTVAPAGSCTFDITANPASAAAFTDNVVVLTLPASTTTPANVALSVTGVAGAPAITLTPPSVVFGARTVNTTSPATLVTLGNAGTGLLTITSITASGDFGFTTSCPISPASLAVSLACPINITFTPLTATAISGSITIVSNAPGSPHIITLTGTGTALPVPGISLAPASLAFAAQTASTSSATQNVVVTNTGFANLTLSAISVGAPFSRVALVSASPPDCATSVAPSSSCQIGLIFTPTAAGSFTGQISITDNASGSPHKVALSGVGTSVAVPVISVNPLLAFGDQVINSSSSVQSLTITNTGAATLSVSAITLSGTNAANFTLSGQSACTSIAPTSSCTLTVTFAATTTGAKTAQINITSNAQNAALVNSVSLSANGILAPRPLLSVTSTAIGFGNVIFGGATPNQSITLTNGGGQAMNIVSVVAVGDFVQMSNCGSSLAPLASCTISIVFTPLLQGNRFGELVVTTNAATSPDRIPLSGTGCRWFSQAQSRFFLTSCGG